MTFFSGPSLLDDLGEPLIILGSISLVSLFFFPRGRRILGRTLGVLFALVVIGGVGLVWRAERLRNADRDLTPAQQAALGKAISQFPTVKFEVLTPPGDREARSLALKIVDAVKAGSGATPAFAEALRTPVVGVVLVLDTKGGAPEDNVANAMGRLLMQARVAVIGDRVVDLGEHTVRVVVGTKP